MTVSESLRAISPYPVPEAAIAEIASECGVAPGEELTAAGRATATYRRARAKTMLYLASAPDISQNGISYSLGADERRRFRAMAARLLAEAGDDPASAGAGTRYGYVGQDF